MLESVIGLIYTITFEVVQCLGSVSALEVAWLQYETFYGSGGSQ